MLHFSHVSDLLEKIAYHNPPQKDQTYKELRAWFSSHRRTIDSLGAAECSALLSTLFPFRRPDRVYGIQSTSLVKQIGRCLGIGDTGRQDLSRYQYPGNGDLADCLERVMLGRGHDGAGSPVTILEVDQFLHYLAGQSRFSAPEVRRTPTTPSEREKAFGRLLKRLTPVEAKWLIRLILKDLRPVELDELSVMKLCHFLLPDLLNVYNNLDIATKVLKETFKEYDSQPDAESRLRLRKEAAASVRPIPGFMVARSQFCKARSINNCLDLTARHKWLIDRKYDGEYCQIHVDLAKGKDWLKIFSKSGRDSTKDRQGLHDTIRKCLRIGSEECQIKSKCIIVGEMVVYNDIHNCIVSFDKIRKHVSRAGSFLGADHDSPAHYGEHLMIVFFDLLLLDDENLLNKPVEKRRERLGTVYRKIEGRAMTVEWTKIDFAHPKAENKLMQQFAAANVLRYEGLVLKRCDTPYLSVLSSSTDHTTGGFSQTIKLKKDYIDGFGDEADFAVIGASYNAQEANKRPTLNLSWTHFHLGCLMNETDVYQHQATPIYKVVATIAMEHCIPEPVLLQINAEGKFNAEQPPSEFMIQADLGFNADVFFRNPFVFEVLGSSYSRPSNAGFFMLRHPRVKRLHSDRTWRECITFDKLQDAAQDALSVPVDSESQEKLGWLTKLEAGMKRKFASQTSGGASTPDSATSLLTPRSKLSVRNRVLRETPLIHVDDAESSPLAPPTKADPARLLHVPDQGVPLLTPPTSSPLASRSSCLNSPTRKRPASTLSERCSKRQRHHEVVVQTAPHAGPRSGTLLGRVLSQSSTSSAKNSLGNKDHRRRSCPLGDVTKFVPQSLHQSPVLQTEESVENHEDEVADGGDVVPTTKPQRYTRIISHQATSEDNVSALCSGAEERLCRLQGVKPLGEQISCFLGKAVVLFDRAKTITASRIRDALHMHGTTAIKDAEDWNRESFAHAPLTEVVSESQSFPGLQKLVLVDSKHAGRLEAAVSQILKLNGGKLQEQVDFYDYRLLERLCQKRSRLSPRNAEEHERLYVESHAVGNVAYDATTGRSIFVPFKVGPSAETMGSS